MWPRDVPALPVQIGPAMGSAMLQHLNRKRESGMSLHNPSDDIAPNYTIRELLAALWTYLTGGAR